MTIFTHWTWNMWFKMIFAILNLAPKSHIKRFFLIRIITHYFKFNRNPENMVQQRLNNCPPLVFWIYFLCKLLRALSLWQELPSVCLYYWYILSRMKTEYVTFSIMIVGSNCLCFKWIYEGKLIVKMWLWQDPACFPLKL